MDDKIKKIDKSLKAEEDEENTMLEYQKINQRLHDKEAALKWTKSELKRVNQLYNN